MPGRIVNWTRNLLITLPSYQEAGINNKCIKPISIKIINILEVIKCFTIMENLNKLCTQMEISHPKISLGKNSKLDVELTQEDRY